MGSMENKQLQRISQMPIDNSFNPSNNEFPDEGEDEQEDKDKVSESLKEYNDVLNPEQAKELRRQRMQQKQKSQQVQEEIIPEEQQEEVDDASSSGGLFTIAETSLRHEYSQNNGSITNQLAFTNGKNSKRGSITLDEFRASRDSLNKNKLSQSVECQPNKPQ